MNINNAKFTINIISDDPSGKSTLINSLLHTELLPTQCETYNSTITRIFENENTANLKISCIDKRDVEIYSDNSVAIENMTVYNHDENVKLINIEGKFPSLQYKATNIVFIEFPGFNNIKPICLPEKYSFFRQNQNSITIYVLSPYQVAGIHIADSFLSIIAHEYKRLGKQARDKFIFVMNKCDEIIQKPDIYINKIKEYLSEFGIIDPIIIPVSAKMALSVRKKELGETLTWNEKNFLEQGVSFCQNSLLHLEKYATIPPGMLSSINVKYADTVIKKILLHTGIPVLEALIRSRIETIGDN